MLDKSEYYHGAAIVRLLENNKCESLKKIKNLGYLANGEIFILLKYRTNSRSPWNFTFDSEDIERCIKFSEMHRKVIVGLICGSDGVCSLDLDEVKFLLGSEAGWIRAARKHKESYKVTGSKGELFRKVSQKNWASKVF